VPGFLVQPEDVNGNELVIRADEAHHLMRARRRVEGDVIDVLDGSGRLFRARVLSEEDDMVRCRILECTEEGGESVVRLHLGTSLIKGARYDAVVEKGTEVGIASFSPFTSERTVASVGSSQKQDRWERLVVAAAKQCGRCRLPLIFEPSTLPEVTQRLLDSCDRVLMATADHVHDGGELRNALAGDPPTSVGLLVGPEGGFAAGEIGEARARGIHTFSWGSRTLRAETACIVLAAIVLHEAEPIRGGG
jgi:16S rRNA (uracil1498-N3)-methyltransferase